MRLNRRRGAVCAERSVRPGRAALFEISAPCTATFKEIPIASVISATVRRVRLRPPAKSCDTNPLVLPRHFATSELVSPRCSTASDNASVTSRISFSPGRPIHKTGTGFAGAKLSEILRLRSRCSLRSATVLKFKWWTPGLLVAQHRIEDQQEFAHARDQRELPGFAALE